MTIKIKCNGIEMATYIKIKAACDFLDNLRNRALAQGLSAQILPRGRSGYILTLSNGYTYEMGAS